MCGTQNLLGDTFRICVSGEEAEEGTEEELGGDAIPRSLALTEAIGSSQL